MNTPSSPKHIIDRKELRRRIPFSPMQLWRKEKDGTFPRRIRLGKNRVGWIESEVEDWVEARMQERFAPVSGGENG